MFHSLCFIVFSLILCVSCNFTSISFHDATESNVQMFDENFGYSIFTNLAHFASEVKKMNLHHVVVEAGMHLLGSLVTQTLKGISDQCSNDMKFFITKLVFSSHNGDILHYWPYMSKYRSRYRFSLVQ